MRIQLINTIHTDNHVPLMPRTFLFIILNLHENIIYPFHRHMISIVGITQRLIVVHIAQSIAQMNHVTHICIH